MNFEEIISRAQGDFEEQNKVLEPSIIIINYCDIINPLNPELNSICSLLALLAHHFLHVSRIRVKSLTIKLLMSYIYIWSAYS